MIELADGQIELSLKQLNLMLFFADLRPDSPGRIVTSNYDALENQGLIEQYIRSVCGTESTAYRITDRAGRCATGKPRRGHFADRRSRVAG